MITYGKSARRRRGHRVGVLSVTAAAVALAITGCSSSSGGATPTAGAPSATGGVISAQSTSLGTILVNGKGLTVYDFANDKSSASTCTGACAANWLFVPAPASLPASVPGVTGKLGTTTRSDGARQLTVAGHPVYTFVGDSSPGQTNGQGITLNGGLWTVVSPAGAPVTNPTGGGGSTPPPAGPTY